MLRIRTKWRMGPHRCKLLCLLSAVCLGLIYYKFSKLKCLGHIPACNVTLQISAPADLRPHSNKAPVAEQWHKSEVSKHVNAIEALLFKGSTCAGNQSYVNATQCSSCLRPGASKIRLFYPPIEPPNRDNGTEFVKPVPEVLQNLITDYLITPRLDCPYLLAVQASLKDRPQERDLVRRTWGSVAETQTWPNRRINAKLKVLFVVANKRSSESEPQHNRTAQFVELLSEALIHNDILYINMDDSYQNLTLKLLSAFRWVKDNCPCVKFVVKVDLDTFVNVPLLIDTLLLHQDQLKSSLLGMVYKPGIAVRRTGKWGVPKSLYPMNYYPQYASGCAYVMSFKVLSQMVETAPHLHIISVEDAFMTGILRHVIGFQMVNMRRAFTHFTDKAWHDCQLFYDSKIVGMNKEGLRHKLIWELFFQSSCSWNTSSTVAS